MKARELAEILMRNPDYEVVIRPDELRADLYGITYNQMIDYVRIPSWVNIPVGVNILQISCKNHFVSENGYKL